MWNVNSANSSCYSCKENFTAFTINWPSPPPTDDKRINTPSTHWPTKKSLLSTHYSYREDPLLQSSRNMLSCGRKTTSSQRRRKQWSLSHDEGMTETTGRCFASHHEAAVSTPGDTNTAIGFFRNHNIIHQSTHSPHASRPGYLFRLELFWRFSGPGNGSADILFADGFQLNKTGLMGFSSRNNNILLGSPGRNIFKGKERNHALKNSMCLHHT